MSQRSRLDTDFQRVAEAGIAAVTDKLNGLTRVAAK
jgi:hypothetical protein